MYQHYTNRVLEASFVDQYFESTTDNGASSVFLHTILMDHATLAILFAFVLLALPNHKQRSFLLFVSVVKVVEYALQLSHYDDRQIANLEGRRVTAATVAAVSALAWIAPI